MTRASDVSHNSGDLCSTARSLFTRPVGVRILDCILVQEMQDDPGSRFRSGDFVSLRVVFCFSFVFGFVVFLDEQPCARTSDPLITS